MAYRDGQDVDWARRSAVNEPQKLKDQAINLLLGECLGQGAYRRVYELKHSPDLVIKLEYSNDCMNSSEWLLWRELSETLWAQWLAPCVSIDEFSGALIQQRARDLHDHEWEGLTKIPAFLGDAGRRNWGWYDGRPVMRDYGINKAILRGASGRMVDNPYLGD